MNVRIFVNSNVRNAYIWVLSAILTATVQTSTEVQQIENNL